MNIIAFLFQEWLLTGTLILLVYLYLWRERVKSGAVVSPSQLSHLVNRENAVVIDMRDAAEFKAGHIVGAINLTYTKLTSDTSELDAHKDKIVILVDKMAQHSGSIGRKLGKLGFDVRRLQGGIAEWQAQNLPLVKGGK